MAKKPPKETGIESKRTKKKCEYCGQLRKGHGSASPASQPTNMCKYCSCHRAERIIERMMAFYAKYPDLVLRKCPRV